MTALARLAVAAPRRVLAGWALAIGFLAVVGIGVEERLHRSSLEIPGTASSEAAELARQHFGQSATMVVLLDGPRAAVDRQGTLLAARLERMPDLTVLAPWNPGGGEILRPAPGQVVLLVRADRSFEQVSREIVPAVREEVDRLTAPPVRAHLSGYPDIAAGIHGSSVQAIRDAELVAAPLLLVVLLLVFRGPVAAALPLAVGVATISAGRGLIELLNRTTPLDAVALNLTTMMGLALGVDYALLLVSRFREELARGTAPVDAALRSVDTAGRTVVFAGVALAAAMVTALLLAPGNLLASASVGVVVAVTLSVISALTALPALLTLLGPAVDRWSFGRGRDRDSRFGGLALQAIRRPALAAALVVGLVAALSAPALALEIGPPDPRVLPASSRERADYDAIDRALGGEWTAHYEIVVAARRGTITEPRRLAALQRWQQRLARRPDVQTVLGPGRIAGSTRPLRAAPRQLARLESALRRGRRDQARLHHGLRRAGSGVASLSGGLADAADGAGRLRAGGTRAAGGADLLRGGLARARQGARQLRGGLREARTGAAALARGAGRLRRGGSELGSGLGRARARLRDGLPRVQALADELARGGDGLERLREPATRAQREVARALTALNRMLPTSKVDPQYLQAYEAVATASGALTGRHPLTGRQVAPGYRGLDEELAGAAAGTRAGARGVRELRAALERLDSGLARLAEGAARARRGAERLDAGARRLERGLARLGAGGGTLADGLARLQDAAGALAGGVRRLGAGAGELQRGLSTGAARTQGLRTGVDRLEDGALQGRRTVDRLAGGLEGADRLGDALSSGYFVLAALDGASPAVRRSSTFAVNLDRGGSAAHIIVVGKGNTARAGHPLRAELERELGDLERTTGTVARLGGAAMVLQDFESEIYGRLWLLVVGLATVTGLVLIPILRSILLPVLAVLLNLLSVAAAFGVLVVLFQGDAPLGGPGFLDAIMVSGIFSVVFGLSIDYEVFLLARMREGYLETGTTDGAIAYGLRRTAGVVTGAAFIMTGVFVAFALTDITSMRQLGIGLTVAVLLDATLIRLVLLPAAIRLCGDAAWWFPRRLDRLLPDPQAPPRPTPVAAG